MTDQEIRHKLSAYYSMSIGSMARVEEIRMEMLKRVSEFETWQRQHMEGHSPGDYDTDGSSSAPLEDTPDGKLGHKMCNCNACGKGIYLQEGLTIIGQCKDCKHSRPLEWDLRRIHIGCHKFREVKMYVKPDYGCIHWEKAE